MLIFDKENTFYLYSVNVPVIPHVIGTVPFLFSFFKVMRVMLVVGNIFSILDSFYG